MKRRLMNINRGGVFTELYCPLHDDFRDITGKHATENKNGQLVEDVKFGKMYDATNGYVEIDEMKWYKDLMGTGNFTVECWAYITNESRAYGFLSDGTDDTDGKSVVFAIDKRSSPVFYFCPPTMHPDVNRVDFQSFNINDWNHFACVGIDGVCHCYVNGILKGNTKANMKSWYDKIVETRKLGIGQDADTIYKGCKICEFRISNISRYENNFTPSYNWTVD